MSTNKPPRGDALWLWYMLTVVYLGFGAIVLYDRWGEVGSLFEPPGATPGRLPLNSIGDILAGFFAPLAFLWLFVATQLQRKELRLQREELADTRRVLGEQKAELKRSAEESNLQTAIMQKTLDASRSQVIYDDFNLRLYFIAKKFLKANGAYVTVEMPSHAYGMAQPVISYPHNKTISQTDPTSIDDFFEIIALHIHNLTDLMHKGGNLTLQSSGSKERLTSFFENALPDLVSTLNTEIRENNDIIISRIEDL